jgi:hypothetical protein
MILPVPPGQQDHNRIDQIAAVALVASVVGAVVASRYIDQRLRFCHAALYAIATELLSIAVLKRHRVLQSLKVFFTAVSHPLNLAIFRMAVFYAIFNEVDLPTILSFSRMPPGLRFAPWGMTALLPHLPINPISVKIAAVLLLVCSATGFLGIFCRTSALACTILGLYALGIPQFYGKVNHDNHLIWFVAILAVSPCGDFFSLDAVAAAWKRADRGIPDPPVASRVYALPLRLVMLLMGVIYFFPGFWKLWQCGFDWFLTDNLPRQLHLFWTWSFDGHWLPPHRVDRHIVFSQIAGGATVVFEVSFIFLMFSKKLRAMAALGGLVFHAATDRFMRISFLSLRVCYVALFDWASILRFLGLVLSPVDFFFVYDGTSISMRRLVGVVQVCDVFGRVSYVNRANKEVLGRMRPIAALSGHEANSLEVFAAIPDKSWTGLSAYCALARRVPLLWPIVLILYFRSSTNRASVPHRFVVTQRLCQSAGALPMAGAQRLQLACVAVVGCALLVGNVSGGIGRRINGWPFACYPTFSLPPPERIVSLGVSAVAPSGRETVVDNFGFPYHRFYGLSRNILVIENASARNERLLLLWARAVQTAPELRTTVTVKFYVEDLWIDPNRWGQNPQDRKLLYVWQPPPDGSIPQAGTPTIFTDTEWQ